MFLSEFELAPNIVITLLFYLNTCTPSLVIRRKISFLWPPIITPLHSCYCLPTWYWQVYCVQGTSGLLSNWQILHAGCPFKLYGHSQHSIITQITTGKAANVVLATKHINTIISNPVSSQTVRDVLKRPSFKAVTKKEKVIACCNPQEGTLGLCYELPGMDCGGLEESYLVWWDENQQARVRWEAVGVDTGGRGADWEGDPEHSQVWWWKHYGMGLYGVG